jgi:hypothetical protein
MLGHDSGLRHSNDFAPDLDGSAGVAISTDQSVNGVANGLRGV